MMPVAELITEIASNFPPIDSELPINLLVEAGPKLLLQMVEQGLIDNLYLTTNLEKDGEDKIAVDKLTNTFKLISSEKIDSCQFEYYKRLA